MGVGPTAFTPDRVDQQDAVSNGQLPWDRASNMLARPDDRRHVFPHIKDLQRTAHRTVEEFASVTTVRMKTEPLSLPG